MQKKPLRFILRYIFAFGTLCGLPTLCMAVSLGDVANNLLGPTRGITELMYGVSYVAGAGMLVMALMQYKAHRDNPSQVRLGTPIAFLIFGLIFIFIPLVSRYSTSSRYVTAHERAQRAKSQAPLKYGKHRPEHRPQSKQRPQSSAPSSVPINPDDSDWYQ